MKSCRECGSETTVRTLDSFSGAEGSVTVTVDGMPAVVCSRNHKRFLYAEFAPLLIDFAAEPERIAPQPPATRRGLIRKHYHCNGCDAELPVASSKTHERTLDALFRNAAPFKVRLQVALYRCERCGREQVRSNEELAGDAFKALTQGFHAVDIHPDR
jgi:DNA-directed RNA polymerase subunit RPC12/RpoP